MPTKATFLPPAVEQYVEAFRSIMGLKELQLQMLRIHYHAPMRTVTATQLAKLSGYSSYSVANAQYGRLAGLIGEKLNYRPEPEQLGTLVKFEKRHGEWHWLMRLEVAQALEYLGWVKDTGMLLPEDDEAVYSEGAVAYRQHRVIERDASLVARAKAARLFETGALKCEVCKFDFSQAFGSLGQGFIEAHHIRPISTLNGASVAKVSDLALVCSNCHRMLHRAKPVLLPAELRALLRLNDA